MLLYFRSLKATDNAAMKFIGAGEGFHNFHHAFPWDYRSAELGEIYNNQGKNIIDFLARFNWAYDLRTVSEDMIIKRAARTGDGTNRYSNCIKSGVQNDYVLNKNEDIHQRNIWGWDDTDFTETDKKDVLTINKKFLE